MSAPNIVAFNGNIDFTKQIIIINGDALGYRSRCEGKAISLYRNGELLADGTMSTGEVGGDVLPSLCAAELTYYDETFEAFSQDDTYTVVIGGEEPIGMTLNGEDMLVTQELHDNLYPSIADADNMWAGFSDTASTFSIAQNVQTTRKKYDVKLLPEELLPKNVAKKSEVKSVERVANDALNTANRAYNNAYNAQSTAKSAQSTAKSAQSTAQSAKTDLDSLNDTVVKRSDGHSYRFDAKSNSSQYPTLSMVDYSQYRAVSAEIDENIGLILSIMRDGGAGSINTINNPATIKVVNVSGRGGVVIDGLRSIIMTSSTPNSTKQFEITVDDTGTISATEVTA